MSFGVFKIMSGSQVSVGYVGAFIDFVWFSGFRWVCRLVLSLILSGSQVSAGYVVWCMLQNLYLVCIAEAQILRTLAYGENALSRNTINTTWGRVEMRCTLSFRKKTMKK